MVSEGYGRCWWARPGAAELPDQDALALAQHHKRQLQIRRLMPRVMLQLTAPQTDSNQSAAAGEEAAGAAANEDLQGSGDIRAILSSEYTHLLRTPLSAPMSRLSVELYCVCYCVLCCICRWRAASKSGASETSVCILLTVYGPGMRSKLSIVGAPMHS